VDRRNITYFQTSDIEISNPEQAPIHIDGDPAETAGSFKIKVVKQAIHLLHRFR
jgi:diacylglycerol kinase family enzyme